MTETPDQLAKKDRISGKVVKTTLAGAVVDLGSGKLGVVPISQLSKEPVHKVEDVLKEGDQVDVWVRRINADNGHIELTMVEPLALEWRELKKGMVLSGKVSKLEKFGAFVEVGAERPGLLHVSEMSHDYVRRPEDVVKPGDEIEVMVLAADRRKKQIKLSIKALNPEPIAEPEPEEEPQKPAPTAMEIALRKAMAANEAAGDAPQRTATKKQSSDVMEDILSRTLENRRQ
ncbi:MAG: S1 RNA-binding domain-containing protein [Anaerolineales bacterium]|nr:S1 RNA-binding domain-containing protein [Anaerolineales bacterium]